jgi:SAM-dependent methyltransferase
LETVTCELCGADNTEVLFEGVDHWYNLPGRFPVRRCRECGLIYLNPRPDRLEIHHYYPQAYEPYSPAIDDELSLWRRLNRRYGMFKRVQMIQARLKIKGRALDVGCATGVFLEALQRHGWEVHGVEPNAEAAAYARSRLRLDVFNGELVQARFPACYFDLVTLWHVLEHVHQPRQMLLEAARITRPGGMLVLALPNPDSLEARLFGPFWAGWDVPRHLYIFPVPVISKMLRETGWHMFDTVCLEGRMWLFNLSLRHWLADNVSKVRWRRFITGLAGSLPMRLLTIPYFMVVERLKQGSIIAILAQRM